MNEKQKQEQNKIIEYSNGVLIGNWSEERKCYQKNMFRYETTFSNDFPAKPYSKVDENFIWDLRLRDAEDRVSLMKNENYMENFSTTYDLSYNHFPKCYKGPIERKLRGKLPLIVPVEEYCENFGNVTQYGLVNYHKQKWHEDLQNTYKSQYQETYTEPNKEYYKIKRFAVPLSNSSNMVQINKDNCGLKYRGKYILCVPPAEQLVVVEKEKRYNPITWSKC